MANRLKSKKSQRPASGKLKSEKEARVNARQIVKDERTHKITGAVFLLLAALSFYCIYLLSLYLEGRSG